MKLLKRIIICVGVTIIVFIVLTFLLLEKCNLEKNKECSYTWLSIGVPLIKVPVKTYSYEKGIVKLKLRDGITYNETTQLTSSEKLNSYLASIHYISLIKLFPDEKEYPLSQWYNLNVPTETEIVDIVEQLKTIDSVEVASPVYFK